MTSSPASYVMLGSGGHASVCYDVLQSSGVSLSAIVCLSSPVPDWAQGIVCYASDDVALEKLSSSCTKIVNGIGQLPKDSNAPRHSLFERYRSLGFDFPVIKHMSAVVSQRSSLGTGVQVMAGAVIQPNVVIGDNTIVNTRASIDHDTMIGRHCHIAPGATICGGVTIGDQCFVGAGAILLPGTVLRDNSLVSAGSVFLDK